jgi:hypothetical protein
MGDGITDHADPETALILRHALFLPADSNRSIKTRLIRLSLSRSTIPALWPNSPEPN